MLPTCQRYGMGAVVWSPLAQGWLTGKWRRDAPPNDTNRQKLQPHLFDMTRADNQQKLDLVAEKLVHYRDTLGPASILNYRCGGSMGIMKLVTDYFFERFGPVRYSSDSACGQLVRRR